MLVVHVGLPKTGTTYLQHSVLGRSEDIAFVHRKRGPLEAELCWHFRRFADSPPLAHPFRRWRLARLLRAYAAAPSPGAAARPIVVSEENISVMPMGFWRGGGPSPRTLARRLATLARQLDGRLAPLRVIIGLRRPDHWLASRYAESSKHFPEFGQADFDRRLQAIARAPFDGPLGWLDHALVADAFAGALGAENVLILPLDRLADGRQAVLDELGRFLGGVRLADPGGRRRNPLGLGGEAWRLRRDGARLELRPELAAALLARLDARARGPEGSTA